MKLVILLLLSIFPFYQLFAQAKPKIEGNEKCPCGGIPEIKTLIGKWYDFSPDYYVEQRHNISYFLKNPNDLRDSSVNIGTLIIRPDGTYEQTYKLTDSIKTKKGSWTITGETCELNFTFKITYENEEILRTWSWRVLEVNETHLIMKVTRRH